MALLGRSWFRSRNISEYYVVLLFFLTAINYLDRQSLSVVAPLLQRQLSLSAVDYSRIVFLFLLGYTVGQVINGKIIDKIGSRWGIALCVAAWSAVSMLHAFGRGIVTFGVLRFLLGIAEAGNWPGGVKVIAEHVPQSDRAFAIGIFNSGSTAGAVVAPPLVAAIVANWGWHPMFVVIGATGFVWLLFWNRLNNNHKAAVELGPLDHSKGLSSLRTLLRHRAVWGLMAGRFLADPVWWFYAFWLPEYLSQSRGFSLAQIGRFAWIPFAFAGAGGWLGGWISDVLVRYGGEPVAARKTVMIAGAALMLSGSLAVRVRSGAIALALISVVVFAFTAWQSNLLSLTADLFPGRLLGQVTGITGTAAAIGGMLLTLATGWLVVHVSYGSVFLITSGMSVFAVIAILVLIPHACFHQTPAQAFPGDSFVTFTGSGSPNTL